MMLLMGVEYGDSELFVEFDEVSGEYLFTNQRRTTIPEKASAFRFLSVINCEEINSVLTGLTDAQLENLDMIEGDEYERKTVEVVLTDTLEKMEVEAFIWANKDDPDMYGEWDFEEWKRLHMEKFIEASKKFIEWKKNPNGKTREEFAKFVNEDPPVA
ncbi:hypothetical protein F2Q70_00018436 [Brassica cretica]|uniref:Putative gamma-glutamylcyclotransferase n=1 Tax=Brassica cretica TaxID=69181 RepID=A0A8S9HZP6_BRACR|nr:hypothetical protein F2Q70_00018436 [Brassica cretica]